MAWIEVDLETLTDIFIEVISEGKQEQVKIAAFSGFHEQRISYGSFMRRTYQITSGTLDATESAAFITFYNDHGNLIPFKFVRQSETIYVRFDGGYIMDGTISFGVKKSVRFGLKEVNAAEIIT